MTVEEDATQFDTVRTNRERVYVSKALTTSPLLEL